MKVELITLHRVKNYGSVLQTYATQEILKKNGCEVEVLDYYPKRYTKIGMLKNIKNQNKYLKKNAFLRFVARIIIFPSYVKRFKIFNNFILSNLNLSNKIYKDYSDINNDKKIMDADLYLTGSDQVWNSEWNNGIDRCLFLDFEFIKNKIAYAASFGKKELDESEKKEIAKMLKKYKAISLREKSGVEICNKLGIENTINVLDPTLLLNDDDWAKISSHKFQNKKYILVYNLNRNKKIDSYAKNLSLKTGLKVKYLSYQYHEFFKYGKMYCNPKVEDFLSLIKNASYVITDSFHATAFSIIFKREFIIVYPEKFSTRLQSILEVLELENRVVKNVNDFDILKNKIDYKKVSKLLEKERKKSILWLYERVYKKNEEEKSNNYSSSI